MAIISPSTFDPLKRYVAVRLQQGVPIVDADWNESDDVRRFELRAFLKWFVGDGVPDGNDGFRIFTDDSINDFTISPGAGVSGVLGAMEAGRCLVDGLDVLITAPIRFRNQPLHVSQPGSAALAAAWGVPVVTELGDGLAPTGIWPLSIYIDVWERLVTQSEDPDLVFDGLGTESCARMRREWVVRWRVWDAAAAGEGRPQTVPNLGEPDYQAGHSYYSIATIVRNGPLNPTGVVHAADVTDLRERRLLMPPATLVEDTLGITSPVYRINGQRPVTNLRAAINALLRGELPGTASQEIEPNPGGQQTLIYSTVLDAQAGAVAVWTNKTFFSTDRQVHAARLDTNAIASGYGSAVSLTSGTEHRDPSITKLPNGDLVLMYLASTGDVFYQRGTFPLGGPENLIATVAPGELPAFDARTYVAFANDVLIFIYTRASGNWAEYRRYRVSDDTWLDSGPMPFPDFGITSANLSNGVVDNSGRFWLAGADAAGIKIAAVDIATGALVLTVAPSNTSADDGYPVLMKGGDGHICAFWGSDSREFLFGAKLHQATGASIFQYALEVPGKRVFSPSAVQDGTDHLVIYYAITNVMAQPHPLQMVGLDMATGTWGTPRNITLPGNNHHPAALLLPNQSTLLHWNVLSVQYKQVITRI